MFFLFILAKFKNQYRPKLGIWNFLFTLNSLKNIFVGHATQNITLCITRSYKLIELSQRRIQYLSRSKSKAETICITIQEKVEAKFQPKNLFDDKQIISRRYLENKIVEAIFQPKFYLIYKLKEHENLLEKV